MTDLTETAVVVSAPAASRGPSAVLPYRDRTVVARLLHQLEGLGAGAHHLLVRSEWVPALEPYVDGGRLHPYDDEDGLFRALATVAEASSDAPLLVVPGDVLTHDDALADLVADSRVRTAVLARSCARGEEAAARGLRTERGAVVSGGSSRHRVSAPDHDAPCALRVDARDRTRLADAARRLAEAAERAPVVGRADAAADVDPVAQLTVALVRDGGAVAVVELDGYAWVQPRSADEVRSAEAALAAVDTERIRLQAAVKGRDGFFTTFLVSPYSRHLARWAARRGMTPNQVTMVSLLVGLVAAVSVATGDRVGYVLGAVLFQVSFTLDCVDGQLARYRRSFSALGAWLDATFDRVKEYAVYAGLAIGASRAGDDVWVLALAAMTLLTFRHTVDLGYDAVTRPGPPVPVRLPLAQRDDVVAGAGGGSGADEEASRGSSTAVRAIGSVDRWPWAVWAKRVVILPIGERWALISLTVAFFDPRVTFTALLLLGGLATAYTLAGRVMRTAVA